MVSFLWFDAYGGFVQWPKSLETLAINIGLYIISFQAPCILKKVRIHNIICLWDNKKVSIEKRKRFQSCSLQ